MKAGDVFYFINFKFEDGSSANKILIILNTPQKNEPYLVCLTTSVQKKWRTKELGCHSKDNYYFSSDKFYSFTDTTRGRFAYVQ